MVLHMQHFHGLLVVFFVILVGRMSIVIHTQSAIIERSCNTGVITSAAVRFTKVFTPPQHCSDIVLLYCEISLEPRPRDNVLT